MVYRHRTFPRWTAGLGLAAVLVAAPLAVPLSAASSNVGQEHEFFVSPDGDDSDGGTRDRPFRTLDKARDAVRSVEDNERGVTVYLYGGTYELEKSFELDARDSGRPGRPVTWRSYPGQQATLVGGAALPASSFGPVTDPEVLLRLAPQVRDRVRVIDLAAVGITDYGEIAQGGFGLPDVAVPAELYVDGAVQTLARYPNDGFLRTASVVDPGGRPVRYPADDPRQAEELAKQATFTYSDPRPESWQSLDDVWMQGYWFYDWAYGNLRVSSVDAANNSVTTATSSWWGMRDLGGRRHYYYNVLEELESPGEYYLDRRAGKLYFHPRAGFETADIRLSMLGTPVIQVNDASHVSLEHLTITASRGHGVHITGGSDNGVDGVTIRGVGGYGVVADDGRRHIVKNSTIYQTGGGGIALSGGDRPTLRAGNNSATNNNIFAYARLERTHAPAVSLKGVGNRAAHNYMHDAPHNAILLSGNDHVVEYNEIARVVQETGDSGAIYLGGRDWSKTGNVIRYNYIRHVDNNEGIGPKVGIYLDDFSTGITVTGNVLANVGTAVLIGGGRNNLVDNNLIIRDERFRAIWVDARGVTWARNGRCCQPGGYMVTNLQASPYQTELWARRYPYLVNILDDEPFAPKYNVISDNVIYRAPDIKTDGHADPYITREGNWVTNADNISPLIAYNGTWQLHSAAATVSGDKNALDFGGTVTYSGTADDSAELTFTGTILEVAVRKGPVGGKADIIVDGTVVASDVDTYAAQNEYRQVIYSTRSLGAGTHTVRVVVKGTKNPASANTLVMLDHILGGEDMRFLNEAEEDYRLHPDSPVYSHIPDFEPIPWDEIGIRQKGQKGE